MVRTPATPKGSPGGESTDITLCSLITRTNSMYDSFALKKRAIFYSHLDISLPLSAAGDTLIARRKAAEWIYAS